jgi:hypothetical protein
MEAHEPERPQRVLRVRGRAQHPEDPPLQIPDPAGGVDRWSPLQRHRHRVGTEVAPAQVLLDRPALEPRDVAREAPATVDRPPGAELLGQGKRRPSYRPRDRAGGRLRIAVHDDVDVAERAPQQRVAHHPAYEPGVTGRIGKRLADRPHGLGRLQALLEGRRTHGSSARRTLDERPQVIS